MLGSVAYLGLICQLSWYNSADMNDLQLVYPAVFNPNERGGYDVSFPDFPGCVTYGDSLQDAQKYAAEALQLWLEEIKERGEYVPDDRRRPLINDVAVQLT